MTDNKFIKLCKDKVREYIEENLYKNDRIPYYPCYDVFVVWYCKTLQHWKALVSTTLVDGMYYEITLNGITQEIYLDVYKKSENIIIKL